jgi:hypothetical protein
VLALAGCGGGGQKGTPSFAAKVSFVVAADRICAIHLQNVMAWLEQPHAGRVWEQQAVTNEGIYRILGSTIHRLEALGPPPGPDAAEFAGYLRTLKARAIVYRLVSTANRRRDTSVTSQLEHRLDAIDVAGDRDAHRYGQRLCGAGLPDLNKGFFAEPKGTGATRV